MTAPAISGLAKVARDEAGALPWWRWLKRRRYLQIAASAERLAQQQRRGWR